MELNIFYGFNWPMTEVVTWGFVLTDNSIPANPASWYLSLNELWLSYLINWIKVMHSEAVHLTDATASWSVYFALWEVYMASWVVFIVTDLMSNKYITSDHKYLITLFPNSSLVNVFCHHLSHQYVHQHHNDSSKHSFHAPAKNNTGKYWVFHLSHSYQI